MQHNKIRKNFFFLSLFLIFICFFATNLKGEEARTIQVGFFNTPGFSETNVESSAIGYLIDYFTKLSDYTGWNYEFIEVKNFADASNKLINGEIDILAPVMKTENYRGRFLFSENSMGTQYGGLLTKVDNNQLNFADFENFQEIKIGYVSQTGVSNLFLTFAQNYGLESENIEYDTVSEMMLDLEENEIQAVVTDLSFMLNSMKVLAEFTPSPVYFATKVTNFELMEEINEAMGWMKLEEPFYEGNLLKKYFEVFEGIPLTQEEIKYINQAPIWRVGYVTELDPLSYEVQKKGAGILADILKMIQKNTGLYFELIPIETQQINKEMVERLELDLVLGVEKNSVFEDLTQVKFTNPIYHSIHVFVGKRGIQVSNEETFKVAIGKGFTNMEKELLTNYPNVIIQKYDTPAECMNAVRTGDVKVMMQDQQVAKYHLGRPIYENLEILPMAVLEEELSIAVISGHQPSNRLKYVTDLRLVNVLNKGIKYIKDSEIEMCVLANSVGLPSILGYEDFFYTYKNLLGFVALIICVGVAVIYRIAKTHSANMKIIRKNERELSYLTHNINGGVIALKANNDLVIEFINNGMIRMLNMDERAIKNFLGNSFLTLVHREDRERLRNLEPRGNETGYDFSREIRMKTSDGNFIPVILQGILSKEKGQEPTYYCIAFDIREQKEMITKLSEERERFSMVLEQAEDIIFDVNIKRGIVNFSSKFEEVFGDSYKWKSLKTGNQMAYVYPDDIHVMKEISKQIEEGKEKVCERIRLMNKEQQYIWCEIRLGCVRREGIAVRVVGKITDIDGIVREKENLEQKNKLDLMTGLLNKESFRSCVETYLENDEEKRGALLFIDLDNFKTLNDTLGHMTGDIVLKEVGTIISEIFRKKDFLARFGGDEFVIFSPGIDKEVFYQRAQMLREKLILTHYSEDKSQSVTISASMGYIYMDETVKGYNELMEQADKALYSAKMQGKNQLVEYTRMIENENTPLMQALFE